MQKQASSGTWRISQTLMVARFMGLSNQLLTRKVIVVTCQSLLTVRRNLTSWMVGKYARLNKMIVDIGFWSLENPFPRSRPANLMVIAKNMQQETETEFVNLMTFMRSRGYNVICVLDRDFSPEATPFVYVEYTWFWELISSGAKPSCPAQLWDLQDRGYRTFFNRKLKTIDQVEDDGIPCPFCRGDKCY
ncbi:uncharacterized protein LOC111830564 [Capsella rubella]|uniref:uncharacterized protein LOC111830564 n=1 Tax=Capsella rubella TaxID=81985 RepID=UPI000CD49FF2|nr:uncharacterized protein LOC111830564 [Capsella rubella]